MSTDVYGVLDGGIIYDWFIEKLTHYHNAGWTAYLRAVLL
jgi:hypothetical protein